MIREVKIKNGTVRGIEAADPRITAFKGIPFAAPPVGDNRWRAPKPAKDWDGVLEAYRFAPISMQSTPGIGDVIYNREWHVDPDIKMSEDCLYLNVWTNAKTADDRFPVLVWFFGGGLQWGYPSEMEFDGERIARRDVVVVTVNYRINVFGFLAHPELTKENPDAPANFGNLDQQAGIKWVKENIAIFGGDPDNITIAGQSAGGGSVLSQMACPDNKGLFNKAVIMSGMIGGPYSAPPVGRAEPLCEAEKRGAAFFEYLGVKTLAEARALDAFVIRDKYYEFADKNGLMFTVRDDRFCIGNPIELLIEKRCTDIPIMAGNTTDEFPAVIPAASSEEFRAKAAEIFGDRADEFLAFDEARKKSEEGYAPISGLECTIKNVFLRNRANGGTGGRYYYRFDPDIPGWDDPGTFHSVDLWFFFETLAKCWRPFEGRHYDLARQMCNYFTNFIKTGDPNGDDADGTPLPKWESYEDDTRCEMEFTSDGAKPLFDEESDFMKMMIDQVTNVLGE